MKKIATLLLISIFFLSPLCSEASRGQRNLVRTAAATPGEILSVTCSDPYPTLGQPVFLLISLQGAAVEPFTETLTIIDTFFGFVLTDGKPQWISDTITEYHQNITIGKLPKYWKKIPWYPSVVGNHSLHVTAESSSESHLNISVGFDVEGIITPSLGCPIIITKDSLTQVSITLSEERLRTSEPAHISTVLLQSIENNTIYHLTTRIDHWSTWIPTGPKTVEDELIISYDIEDVPIGFYNLTVKTTQNYSWPHAVQILATSPLEYAIIQLSDTHIGKYSNVLNKKQELICLLTTINEVLHPAFVLLTGDSVDWYNPKATRNVFTELQDALLTCHSPVYIIPGNHERYRHSLLFLYFPFTDLTGYHRYLNPLNDYAITYGTTNFIFLDSGYEYSRWEIQRQIWNTTPEGSGLTNTQLQLLREVWGNNRTTQLIIMHHLAVSHTNDTGLGALPNTLPSGNNECIAFNRAAFIDCCLGNNVSLILSGHTHENRVLTSLGKAPANTPTWPLFVQTCSSTLSGQDNGGRVIRIQNNTVVSYEYLPMGSSAVFSSKGKADQQ